MPMAQLGATDLYYERAEQGAPLLFISGTTCASPSRKTNKAIFALNQQQRDRGIKPQCDINGTLCGQGPAPAPD